MNYTDIKINGIDYSAMIADAVDFFWNTKQKQLSESGDSSNRSAVVGGKQMDGFIELLRKLPVMLVCHLNMSLQIKTIFLAFSVHRKIGICL